MRASASFSPPIPCHHPGSVAHFNKKQPSSTPCQCWQNASRGTLPLMEGVALLERFINLPGVKNSKSRVTVSEWLEGTGAPVGRDEEFDGFVEWLNGVLVSFAAWLMRSCGTLSAIVEGWPSEVSLLQLSEFCELGVDTTWAVTAQPSTAESRSPTTATPGPGVPRPFMRSVQKYAELPARMIRRIQPPCRRSNPVFGLRNVREASM